MTRIDESLAVSDSTTHKDYKFTAAQVINALTVGGGGSRIPARTSMVLSYATPNSPSNVFFTSLAVPSGVVVTSRTSTGVTYNSALGLWVITYDVTGATDFVAVWDEGDPAVYSHERIVVDT